MTNVHKDTYGPCVRHKKVERNSPYDLNRTGVVEKEETSDSGATEPGGYVTVLKRHATTGTTFGRVEFLSVGEEYVDENGKMQRVQARDNGAPLKKLSSKAREDESARELDIEELLLYI